MGVKKAKDNELPYATFVARYWAVKLISVVIITSSEQSFSLVYVRLKFSFPALLLAKGPNAFHAHSATCCKAVANSSEPMGRRAFDNIDKNQETSSY